MKSEKIFFLNFVRYEEERLTNLKEVPSLFEAALNFWSIPSKFHNFTLVVLDLFHSKIKESISERKFCQNVASFIWSACETLRSAKLPQAPKRLWSMQHELHNALSFALAGLYSYRGIKLQHFFCSIIYFSDK